MKAVQRNACLVARQSDLELPDWVAGVAYGSVTSFASGFVGMAREFWRRVGSFFMMGTLDSALSLLAARGPSAPALSSSEPEVEYVFVSLEPGSTAQLSGEVILKVRG